MAVLHFPPLCAKKKYSADSHVNSHDGEVPFCTKGVSLPCFLRATS